MLYKTIKHSITFLKRLTIRSVKNILKQANHSKVEVNNNNIVFYLFINLISVEMALRYPLINSYSLEKNIE